MHIRTTFEFPPIPCRDEDWSAVDDSTYEPGQPIGRGRTELAAVKDLIAQLEDDYEPRAELNAAFAEWWERHTAQAKERHEHFMDEFRFEANYTV